MMQRSPAARWQREPWRPGGRGHPLPLRLRLRRAVRLLAAAGTAGLGMCLVVGAVALVAEITALPAPAHQHPASWRKPATLASIGHGRGPAMVPRKLRRRSQPGQPGPASRWCPPLAGVRFWLGLEASCARR
ncbi:MAG TPA: hypothetical protein VH637_03195 [Streptosporangiaceae bacterium]|jgi:hypothetical protein